MRYVFMFLLGIGGGLWLRQGSLPCAYCDSYVSFFWVSPGAELVLLLPFIGALFGGFLSFRFSRFASYGFCLAAFCLGAGLAGLDTRAPDLPRHWVSQPQSAVWVLGDIEGLPQVFQHTHFMQDKDEGKDNHKSDRHAEIIPASQPSVRLQFTLRAKCWRPMPAATDANTDWISQVKAKALNPKRASHRRGRCPLQTQSLPAFWRKLKISMPLQASEYAALVAAIQAGQQLWLPVKRQLVRGQSNPGAMDFGRWSFVNYAGGRARVQASYAPVWLHSRLTLDAVRAQLSEQIRDNLAGYPLAQALLPAIMLGDRRWLTPEDWQALNRLGLGHLIAISGLHIGFAAALGYYLGLFFLRRMLRLFPKLTHLLPLQFAAWGLAWCSGAAYAALSGFALPAVRALLALTLVCLWRWRFQQLSLAQVWLMCAALLLSFSPRGLFDTSFLLSFGAVGVLIWCLSAQMLREPAWRKAWRLQWGLSLGLMPMNAAFFNQITWLSPVILITQDVLRT